MAAVKRVGRVVAGYYEPAVPLISAPLKGTGADQGQALQRASNAAMKQFVQP